MRNSERTESISWRWVAVVVVESSASTVQSINNRFTLSHTAALRLSLSRLSLILWLIVCGAFLIVLIVAARRRIPVILRAKKMHEALTGGTGLILPTHLLLIN
jgi:hypothetical protein